MNITIVAPAGFAMDPGAVDRAEALLTHLGHRVQSDCVEMLAIIGG